MIKRAFIFGTVALSTGAVFSAPSLAGPRQGLRAVAAYSDACGVYDNQSPALLAALVGIVLEPVIAAGVTALGSALKKAGEPDEASVRAQTAGSFYKMSVPTDQPGIKLTRLHNCLIVAVGVGVGDGVALTNAAIGQSPGDFLSANRFTAAPSLLLAGAVELSKDRSAWRYVPEVLYVGSPLTTDNWTKKSGRDLVVTLTLSGIAATADDGVIATRSIKIERYYNGAGPITNKDQLADLATGWMPLPQPSDTVKVLVLAATQRKLDRAALATTRSDALAEAADMKNPKVQRDAATARAAKVPAQIAELNTKIDQDFKDLTELVPVTARFDIHETRDGNMFLVKLGETLSENAAAISKPIADRVSPIARGASAVADRDAAVAAGNAEDTARVAAITAVADWQSLVAANDTVAKQRVAKIAAIGACRTLKLKGFADPACLDVE